MGFFKTRNHRISVELPVRIHLKRKEDQHLSKNSQAGTVTHISKTGACVVVDKIVLDGEHIYFNAQQQADSWLYIYDLSQLIGEEGKHIAAETIWMDTCTFQDRSAFKIGIRFTEEQESLFNHVKEHPELIVAKE